MRTNLKQTQKLIWQLLKAPEGIAKALKNKKLAIPIKPSTKLTAQERLDIYANMYFFRIRDVLKNDFKAVDHLIGNDHFHNLATDYLLKHPSKHYSLRYAGQKLPQFLKKHPLSKKWAYLCDIALLEWAIIESFDASDENVLTLDFVKTLKPENWGSLKLQTTSSVNLIKSAWPLKKIYDQTLKRKIISNTKSETTYMCTWRNDFKVYYQTLSKLEWLLLKQMKKGISVDSLSEIIAKNIKGKSASQETARLLQKWINDNIILLPHASLL